MKPEDIDEWIKELYITRKMVKFYSHLKIVKNPISEKNDLKKRCKYE
jgi:hypothetical protein